MDLPHRDVVVVHLLLFGFDMQQPSVADAKEWAEHFDLDPREGHLVLVGSPTLFGRSTMSRVPGFQLIDRDFRLRFDSTGHQPRHDLWTELLPALGKMIKRR